VSLNAARHWLPALVRITMSARIEYLDGWRGCAIGMVLLAHFGPSVPIDLGRLGVDLFFVLSGLLMSQILFEKRTPIGIFYRRRISRIVPAFVLFVLTMATVFRVGGKELWALLTFTSTYLLDLWTLKAPVGHLWSLNVEEHCYMLLALLAALRWQWLCLPLAALTLVAILVHFHFDHDPNAQFLLNTECASTGLLASAGYRQIANAMPSWASPAAILASLACYVTAMPWWLHVAVAPCLLAFAVNHVGASPLRRPLEWKWLGALGLISYSVYLWQQPFYKGHIPFGMVGALVAGAASFYLFESPIRHWLNAHWAGWYTSRT
jgi:peptidoglycan/LPS O-acetylase OafA/YrhL